MTETIERKIENCLDGEENWVRLFQIEADEYRESFLEILFKKSLHSKGIKTLGDMEYGTIRKLKRKK